MSVTYTTNLKLAEPVTGSQSGTWGDDINRGLTDYLDIAVAGTQTISGSQTAVTLSLTTGSSAGSNISQVGSGGTTGTAQYSIINCTGNPASTLTVTVPASSRKYTVINATSTSQSVKIVGVGPTTGVTLVAGEKADVAWNGSDYVKIGTTSSVSSFSAGSTGLTPSTATTGAVTLGGILGVSNGGTGVTSSTGSGSNVLSTSPTLVTPILGTPTSVTLTNATGLPIASGVSGLGTSVATALGTSVGTAGSFVVNGGALGTPSSGTLTNATGLPLTSGVTGILPVANGGTGLSSTPVNGALDIGNGTGFTRTTLTAGSNVTITNAAGSITIASSNPGGTVTSVGGTGSVNGISLSGTVTSSGSLTLGGTLSGVSLTTQVSGLLPIANGGTNASSAATALSNLGAYPATNPNGYTSNTGTVTSVGGTGSVNGISLSGTVTSTGNLTLGGTLSGVDLTSQITGVLPTANGGTNLSSFTANGIMYATSASALATASFAKMSSSAASNAISVGTGVPATTANFFSAINSSSTANAYCGFYAANGSTNGGNVTLRAENGSAGTVSGMGGIYSVGGGTTGSGFYIWDASYDRKIVFSVSTTASITDGEVLRFNSSKQALFGGNVNLFSASFVVNGNGAAGRIASIDSTSSGDAGNPCLTLSKVDNTTTTSNIYAQFLRDSGGGGGGPYGSGQINANGANQAAFGTYSDSRLKKNIVDLEPQLANIMALRPVEFDYIDSVGGGHQTSFIAQEINNVYPDSVSEGTDGMLTLTGWGKTEARLVKAMQEQQALIEQLTARIAVLEAK
jgi:hypothetical protein